MISVVSLSVIDLDIPVRAHDLRELLRRARVRVKRGNMVDDLLRRFADELPDGDAVLVPRLRLARLPRAPERADHRAGTRKPKLDAVLDPEDLRLANLPPPPVQFFFLNASPTGLMRHSVSHCSASLGWFDLTWST